MTEDLLFRLIYLALLVLFVFHRAYYNRKFPAREEDTLASMPSSWLTRLANLLSIVALLSSVLYIFIPGLVAWAGAPFPTWLRWLGVLLAAAGFGLLEWSHRALAANWSDQPRLISNQELVQSGPYKRIRHPIYTAFLMILGSTLLITANWLVGLAWLGGISLDIYARILFEEAAIQDRFGSDYEQYRVTTDRLLPRV